MVHVLQFCSPTCQSVPDGRVSRTLGSRSTKCDKPMHASKNALHAICVLLIWLLPSATAAKTHSAETGSLLNLTHVSWTGINGAPRAISALAQTRDGYLWIGSSLGLFRFDGLRFSSYPFSEQEPRLLSLAIGALAADRDGGV